MIIVKIIILIFTDHSPAACRAEKIGIASAIVLATIPDLLFLYEKMPARRTAFLFPKLHGTGLTESGIFTTHFQDFLNLFCCTFQPCKGIRTPSGVLFPLLQGRVNRSVRCIDREPEVFVEICTELAECCINAQQGFEPEVLQIPYNQHIDLFFYPALYPVLPERAGEDSLDYC